MNNFLYQLSVDEQLTILLLQSNGGKKYRQTDIKESYFIRY